MIKLSRGGKQIQLEGRLGEFGPIDTSYKLQETTWERSTNPNLEVISLGETLGGDLRSDCACSSEILFHHAVPAGFIPLARCTDPFCQGLESLIP